MLVDSAPRIGEACRAPGQPLSNYENGRGTGNIHIWFDVAAAPAEANR